MDVNGFYALFSATCFTLVGLWWKVVEARPQWHKDEKMKTTAGGIYLSFLIPGLMGLGAQIMGADSPLWRAVFVIGAAFGRGHGKKRLAAQVNQNKNSGEDWTVPPQSLDRDRDLRVNPDRLAGRG